MMQTLFWSLSLPSSGLYWWRCVPLLTWLMPGRSGLIVTDLSLAGQHHAVDTWRRDTFAPGTPANATITERRLWAINPQDYEWRSQFLHEIPDWLAGYFGNRYEKLFAGRDGRRRANTFLRKTIGENVLPRLRKVAARYQYGR